MRLNHLGPDLILFNGKVITIDDRFSIADSIAVKGDRIIGVGAGDEFRHNADDHTRLIDAGGSAVIPGLIDAHAHMDREGLKDVCPSLEGARSIEDILEIIDALVSEAEPGAWIVTMPIGEPPSYFDVPGNLREKRFPTRQDLDRVSPDNPVYIRPIWGFWRHSLPLVSIANSKALELAGITRNTVAPCDSIEIQNDPSTGEPNGVFIENTYMPVVEFSLMRVSGGFTHGDRVNGLHRAMQVYHSFGTTSIFEEHGVAGELLNAYKTVHEQGKLTMRSHLVFSPSWGSIGDATRGELLESWAAWLGGRGMGDSFLRMAGIYTLVESAGGNSPAAEIAVRAKARPYTGWAGFNYDAALSPEELKKFMIEAARADIRVISTGRMLEVFEEVNKVVSIEGKRWVQGHISILTEADVKLARDLGLATSTHTNRNIYRTGSLLRDRIGVEREDDISPLQRMKEYGVPFALATDNAPASMFHPIWQAVARVDRATNEVIAPSQKLSREDALRAATIEGAYLTFEENEKGSIETGKLADFAVLSDDPLTVPEDEIKDIVANVTVVGGRVVYERDAAQ
jgi:predicted amidohydrolase YtcJ